MLNNKSNSFWNTFIHPKITPLFIIPPITNLCAMLYNSNYIKAKGAILSGISKNIIVSFSILFLLSLFYYFLVDLIKKNNKYTSNFKLLKDIILSPFFFIWLISLIYQDFRIIYFDYRILIFLYILLFFSEHLFIKNICNQ